MEKINVAELLKDCPRGMELDCTMYEDVYFDCVDKLNIIHCYIQQKLDKTFIVFNQHGTPNSNIKSKCVIFPKGKTSWEGFQRPFKDGDVVATTVGDFIAITKGGERSSFIPTYCILRKDKFEAYIEEFDDWGFDRLATEAEKQKLFDAIKANGYRWDEKTKKLVEVRFKVGNIIQDAYGYKVKITHVCHEDECYCYNSLIPNGDGTIDFSEQDNWKLVPNKFDITTLKSFESKVLVRDDKAGKWTPATWGYYDDDDDNFNYYVEGGNGFNMCIPFEYNEHLLGKKDDCDDYYKTWDE